MEDMCDTYAYRSFEHIDRNIVMRSSVFDDHWSLMLLVKDIFLNVFLSTARVDIGGTTAKSCNR